MSVVVAYFLLTVASQPKKIVTIFRPRLGVAPIGARS
nr:MAG TPA_asm: hypothetical protein [Caudoviricetes sp.]